MLSARTSLELPYDHTQTPRTFLSSREREILLRPARHQPGGQRRRLRFHHGTVGRREIVTSPYSWHARSRLDRRIFLRRRGRPQPEAERARDVTEREDWLCFPSLPSPRRPDRLREPRHPTFLSPREQGWPRFN